MAVRTLPPVMLPPAEGAREPAWEVALLFPAQGEWTDEDYLALPADGRRVEMTDGRIEVLPMPTKTHQLIVGFLYRLLFAFVDARALGTVLVAGIPVHLWAGKFREPDVVFMRAGRAGQGDDRYWEGADLVVEVVSDDPKDRRRDLVTKRQEYARAGIPEYWIVDPKEERILILVLEGNGYRVHGEFRRGAQAASATVDGFSVSVDAVFDSGATREP